MFATIQGYSNHSQRRHISGRSYLRSLADICLKMWTGLFSVSQ